jgi:hypothetical protein
MSPSLIGRAIPAMALKTKGTAIFRRAGEIANNVEFLMLLYV